jgi:hypothetical protein
MSADLENRFVYHNPSEENKPKHAQVNQTLLAVAEDFDELLPDSREKSLALTKLEEAKFWSNAAIARQ